MTIEPVDLERRLKAETKKCYYCGICEPLCPVFKPLFELLAREHEDGQVVALEEFGPIVDLCYYCKLCLPTCGIGVNFPRLMLDYKIWRVQRQGQTLQNRLLMETEFVGRLASRTAPLANWALSNSLNRRLMEFIFGIDRRRTMPQPAGEPFPRWMKRRRRQPDTTRHKVALFSGCFTDYYDPAHGIAAVQVLERNGAEIVYPPQRCCGLPMLADGSLERALENFRYNVNVLAPLATDGYTIVVLDAPCAMTFRQEVPQFLGTDLARHLALCVRDINQYLLELHRRGELDTDFQPMEGKVVYHASCGAKLQRIETVGADLLRLIPGLMVEQVNKGCCGFGGTFGFKKQFNAIANQVAADLFAWIRSSGAGEAVTDCPLCQIQIADGTGARTARPVEMLANAYHPERN